MVFLVRISPGEGDCLFPLVFYWGPTVELNFLEEALSPSLSLCVHSSVCMHRAQGGKRPSSQVLVFVRRVDSLTPVSPSLSRAFLYCPSALFCVSSWLMPPADLLVAGRVATGWTSFQPCPVGKSCRKELLIKLISELRDNFSVP